MKKLFQEYGITRERFLQALSTVRGNQRVTTDNPEATYDTLEKYGQDIVEKARNQKMDPVIGRDTEIRNVVRILSRKTKNNPVPVSYTHLMDAFKNSLFAVNILIIFVICFLINYTTKFMFEKRSKELGTYMPVSYTHLDVYKRQGNSTY